MPQLTIEFRRNNLKRLIKQFIFTDLKKISDKVKMNFVAKTRLRILIIGLTPETKHFGT
jgi:hypothetical protein